MRKRNLIVHIPRDCCVFITQLLIVQSKKYKLAKFDKSRLSVKCDFWKVICVARVFECVMYLF